MKKPSQAAPAELQRIAVSLAGSQTVRIQMIGESMRPLLRSGDAVFVDPVKKHSLKAGQIITFVQGESLVTHRVIRDTPHGLLTKGDYVRSFDPAVDPADVLGVVVAWERAGELGEISAGKGSRMLAVLSGTEGALQRSLARAGWDRFRLIKIGTSLPFRAAFRLAHLLLSGIHTGRS